MPLRTFPASAAPEHREPTSLRSLSVFIITDVRLYCEGLSHALNRRDALVVLGAATPSEETMSRIAATSPHVVLVDSSTVRRPGMVHRILSACPSSIVVAFGVSDDSTEVLECAEAGVSGYVLQSASLEELVRTLQSVQRGELPCSPRIAAIMFHHVATLAAGHDAPAFPLTAREQAIVGLIGRGLSNKEIATALCIEVATVKSHVHHILEKLGVRRRAAVVARLNSAGARLAQRTYTL